MSSLEDFGSRATAKTSTPMPPMKTVKLRQKRTERGSDSISERMEEPVVVKPEAVSKMASGMDGMAPVKR